MIFTNENSIKYLKLTVNQLKDNLEIKTNIKIDDFWVFHGTYAFQLRSPLKIPAKTIGLALPRSSLLRLGMISHTAVWDPGYEGKGSITANFAIPLIINKNEFLFQILFAKADKSKMYAGYFQHENV